MFLDVSCIEGILMNIDSIDPNITHTLENDSIRLQKEQEFNNVVHILIFG